jgi:hypothetical protein
VTETLRQVHRTGMRRFTRHEAADGSDLIVLQLEEVGLVTSFLGGEANSEWVTRWRNAQVTDLDWFEVNAMPVRDHKTPENASKPTT